MRRQTSFLLTICLTFAVVFPAFSQEGGGLGDAMLIGKSGEQIYAEKKAAQASITVNTDLPSIKVGGKDVVQTLFQIRHNFVDAEVPKALQNIDDYNHLKNRKTITPPPYAAVMGEPLNNDINKSLTLIEFSDLGCALCREEMKLIETAKANLRNHEKEIPMTHAHVYAPSEVATPLALAAFYGRVADRLGDFWDYRTASINLSSSNEQAYFGILSNLGHSVQDIRQIAIQDTAKIYQELDADAGKVKAGKFPNPPFWLLNGIIIDAEDGIAPEKLLDVVLYEKRRQRALRVQAGFR